MAANASGTDTSHVAVLEVYPGTRPTIEEHPTSLTFAVGDTARFWVRASGDPLPAVQWLRDGAELSVAAQDTLVIAGVTAEDAGMYSALIINVADVDTSSVAILNVDTIVGFEEIGGLPKTFALHPNYPNPFNPSTTIGFDLPRAGAGQATILTRSPASSLGPRGSRRTGCSPAD